MNPYERLRRVRAEYDAVRDLLTAAASSRPGDAVLAGLVADLERVFLQRLYATFESILRTEIASPTGYKHDGLANTLQREVGEEKTIDPANGQYETWWKIAQRDRNDLQHGNSQPPALGFQPTTNFLVASLLRLGVRD